EPAAFALAVGAEHFEFRFYDALPHVGGVGVAGHQAQGLLLPYASDHDRWPADRLGAVQWVLEPELAADEGLGVAREHAVGDLEHLLELLESRDERGERQPQRPGLEVVPGGTYPQPGSPAREDVEGRGRLHEHARRPV